MQHCLKLGLMVDVDVQGTSKITMICKVGPRVMVKGIHKQTFSDVQNYKKLGNLNTCRLVKLSCDVE